MVVTRLDEIVHLVGPNEDVIRLVTDTRRLLDVSIQRQFRDRLHDDEDDEEGRPTDGTSSQRYGRGRGHGHVRRTRGRAHPHIEDIQASGVEYQTPNVKRESERIQQTPPAPMRERPQTDPGPLHHHSPLPPLDYDVVVKSSKLIVTIYCPLFQLSNYDTSSTSTCTASICSKEKTHVML